jgi:hypothetical protein
MTLTRNRLNWLAVACLLVMLMAPRPWSRIAMGSAVFIVVLTLVVRPERERSE